ncbi:EAL domain-containing protein [Asticcacaulis sp. EMRT-3]|uniref:putative bifunctional diguanylate cyclase/phosphodiesterase n=1 Tax=Asticcacaulis sp. EMRT-3 TaxID=3040349 RepID=UPI0024AF2478|nr:EAL domain-containing protein [Asticcacaulis sp. EMRT-3]MDI7774094.1 EAL domain-containing protein [Asticcacaulis sp. EMRT-3]
MSEVEETAAMKPIVFGYAFVVSLYYTTVIIYRCMTENGIDRLLLTELSVVTLLVALAAVIYFLPRARRMYQLDGIGLVLNMLLLANPVMFQLMHFNAQRLVYFVFLILMFATTGASLRVIVPSVLAALAAGLWLAYGHSGTSPPLENTMMVLVIITTAMVLTLSVRKTLLRAVSARLQAETLRSEAQALADGDALTGLPNRRNFFRTFEASRAKGTPFSLALVDLDGFKPINDIYGHSVGDALLIEVAERLRHICGERAFPARMGGDEFAIIIHDAMPDAQLSAFGDELCERLRETYSLSGITANISASIGIVRAADREMNASQWLERADYALYYAKQNLRGAAVIFSERHETDMRDFNLVDQTLRSSDLNRELSIVFQPQVDVVEHRTISFEALARWDSARLGAVRPDIFIKAAERSGLITEITLLLLEKALRKVREWPHNTRVSFNLSARDLRSGLSINNVIRTVRDSGIDPHRIEFEITETAMLSDFEQACEALARLKAMGCRIAVDDFGAGYSSFSYIHRLPIDKIKIDRSFVIQLVKHGSALKIVKTIIDLARNLNLECVIEGVETEAEMALLRQVRARHVQGYLFARPMPAEAVLPYLAAEQERLALQA